MGKDRDQVAGPIKTTIHELRVCSEFNALA
jgi:hypothetical protein